MTSIIDAHIHWHDVSEPSFSLFKEYDLSLINICVARDRHNAWRDQALLYRAFAREYPNRFNWCTSFDLPRLDDNHYIENVIAQLETDFQNGAIACKIWKNVGMEMKKSDGSFLMMDDPLFDPLWETMSEKGWPLLAHIGEPFACWQPLDEASPHYNYYRAHPEWHMFKYPEYPSHETLMAARDHVLAKHPQLRMVGAHLGSLEYDADVLRERLDRYPNFAVDTSARMADMAFQDPAKVRRLFEAHPDRILFGTDMEMRECSANMSEAERYGEVEELRQRYVTHFAYFESNNTVKVRGREVAGLGLPKSTLERFYQTNAREWYPLLMPHQD